MLSQALRDRLRYLVLYLRPFFLSNESVHEATEPAAKASKAAQAQHSGNTPSSSVQEESRLAFEAGPLDHARDRSRSPPSAAEAGGLASEAGPLAEARDRSPPPSSSEMPSSSSSAPVYVPFCEGTTDSDEDDED